MDHRRLDAKGWQNDKGKVVICGNHHTIPRRAGVFVADAVQVAFSIYGSRH